MDERAIVVGGRAKRRRDRTVDKEMVEVSAIATKVRQKDTERGGCEEKTGRVEWSGKEMEQGGGQAGFYILRICANGASAVKDERAPSQSRSLAISNCKRFHGQQF